MTTGQVVAVRRVVAGSILAFDLTAGDTTASVLSAAGFPDAGSVQVGDVGSLDYTGIDYGADTGAAFDVLVLAAASDCTAPADTAVTVDPQQVVYLALVSIAGQPPVTARIPPLHRLHALLAPTSTPPGVTVDLTPDDVYGYAVADVVAAELVADLSLAAPGSLKPSVAVDPDDIAASNVVADWLNATDVGGVVFTGSTFQTAQPGNLDRVWLDKVGLHQTADGILGVDITPGQASFGGDVTAASLTAEGDAAFRGTTTYGPGAKVVYGEQTTHPTSPPVLSTDWPSVAVGTVDNQLAQAAGLARGDDGLWTYRSPRPSGGGFTLWAIPAGGGTPVKRLGALGGQVLIAVRGLARLGGRWYAAAFAFPAGSLLMYELDDSGNVTNTFPLPNASGVSAVGDDGTNLLVASRGDDGFVHVLTYETAGTLSSDLTTDVVATGTPLGILSGSFDLGSARTILFYGDSDPVVVNPDGTVDTDNTWGDAAVAQSKTPVGTGWDPDAAAFVELTRDGTFYTYTGLGVDLTGADLTGWTRSAWYQSTQGYETPVGPYATFPIPKRARLTVNVGSLPGPNGPDGARIYMGKGATNPPNAALWLQGVADGGPLVLTALTWTGTNPSSTNTFPAGIPAEATAADGSVLFDATYSSASTMPERIAALEAGGGGGGTGGVDIDCGNATASGVDIDCGSAA